MNDKPISHQALELVDSIVNNTLPTMKAERHQLGLETVKEVIYIIAGWDDGRDAEHKIEKLFQSGSTYDEMKEEIVANNIKCTIAHDIKSLYSAILECLNNGDLDESFVDMHRPNASLLSITFVRNRSNKDRI